MKESESNYPMFTLLKNLGRSKSIDDFVIFWPVYGESGPIPEYNNAQIFLKKVPIMGIYSDQKAIMTKKKVEISRDIECALLYGHRRSFEAPSKIVKTMGGITFYAEKYNRTFSSPVYVDEFEKELFRYGSNSRMVFHSDEIDLIEGSPSNTISVIQKGTIEVVQKLSPHGTLNLVRHTLMREYGALPKIVAVDLLELMLRPVRFRELQYRAEHSWIMKDGEMKRNPYAGNYLCELTMSIGDVRSIGVVK